MKCDGGSHGRVERLDLARQGDRDSQGVPAQDLLRQSWSFRTDHENHGATELHCTKWYTVSRSQRKPCWIHRSEAAGEIGRLGADDHIHSQQAARRSPQGSWMIRMNRPGGESHCGHGEGLCHPGQGAKIPRVLQAIDIEIDAVVHRHHRAQSLTGQRTHSQDSTRGIGIAQVLDEMGGYLGDGQAGLRKQIPAFIAAEEFIGCQDRLESQTGPQGLADEMGSLENSPVAFTASKPTNILYLLILTTDDHG